MAVDTRREQRQPKSRPLRLSGARHPAIPVSARRRRRAHSRCRGVNEHKYGHFTGVRTAFKVFVSDLVAFRRLAYGRSVERRSGATPPPT